MQHHSMIELSKGILMNKRMLTLPTGLLAAALTLTACGSGDDTRPGSGSDMAGMNHSSSPNTPSESSAPSAGASAVHNSADTAFAQQMIEHHRGAIAMAELASTRAASADVMALATQIEAAQQPEIDTMSSWLQAWGEKVPEDMTGMSGMDHGAATQMPGMMTDQQMADLRAANGTAFDRMFLQMMTEHHQGAVTMSQQEQAAGHNPDAIALAKKIIADQTAEITDMQALLGEL